jgi:hypothetical protein
MTVLGLADHDHVLLRGQDLSKAAPDYRVIVCNQDSDGRAPCRMRPKDAVNTQSTSSQAE